MTLAAPSEHEEPVAATNRQQKIIAALDITKNQASARINDGVVETGQNSIGKIVGTKSGLALSASV